MTLMATVLVVDDDRSVLHMVRNSLEKIEVNVVTAGNAADAVNAVSAHRPDVVLLDIIMPETSGLEVFRQISDLDRKLPVIFITAGGSSHTAIEAMQLGAYDYVTKPLDLPKLNSLILTALETRRLMSVPVALPVPHEAPASGDLFIGRSPQMLSVFKQIGRVAAQNVTVLIRGESGTGKELVARSIYQHSKRAHECFMAVNCAAIPDNLLESELFGHERGSFTGADRKRIGKFEQCNGGTIFLDEVGDMSPLVQGKVLRLLQEQRFERVGGNETIQTNVRIIAATNRNLEEMVDDGRFRADLFYRLNGLSVSLPPLRDRTLDIPLLLEHFLASASRELELQTVEGISPEALKLLQDYDWPGNVRELQSVVRQSLLNSSGPVIVPEFLPEDVQHGGHQVSRASEPEPEEDGLPSSDLRHFVKQRMQAGTTDLYAETLEMMERYLFTRILKETNGNQTRASEMLGITRGKIRDRIAAFNIQLDKNVSIDGNGE